MDSTQFAEEPRNGGWSHYNSGMMDDCRILLIRHYRENVWPLIENIVTTHAMDLSTDRLVLEGSAILPERSVTLPYKNTAAIWLTASRELLAQRIYTESQYTTKSPPEKALIDKFLQRTWQYNDLMLEDVKRLGLASLIVDDTSHPDELIAACRSLINR